MSVIVREDTPTNAYGRFSSKYIGFVKGSPEKIYELCKKETIPSDFNQILFQYTKQGFRVIGLARKEIKN